MGSKVHSVASRCNGGVYVVKHFSLCHQLLHILLAKCRLVAFMKDIVLPLAADTNAVILGCCNEGECFLTEAFLQAVSLERAKWGTEVPFFFLGLGAEAVNIYQTKDPRAYWRKVRQLSSHWRMRHKIISEAVAKYPTTPVAFDLSATCPNIIMCDSVDESKFEINQKVSFVNFNTELLRHLSNSLPSITLKTGFSVYNPMGGNIVPSSCDLALMCAKAGSPVLFLDLRQRPLIEAADRKQLIDKAKEHWIEYNAQLEKMPISRCDNFDVCGVAYLHHILFGKQSGHTPVGMVSNKQAERVSLHYALQRCREGENANVDFGLAQGATKQQVHELVNWFTRWNTEICWNLLTPEQQADPEVHKQYWQDILFKMNLVVLSLIEEENFHSVNISDLHSSQQLVRELVKLDRLPKQESHEGLLLLRDAWDEYDVAMYLAAYYKRLSKISFLVNLLIGIAIVSCTVMQVRAVESLPSAPSSVVCQLYEAGALDQAAVGNIDLTQCTGSAAPGADGGPATQLTWAVFLLSVFSSIILSMTSFTNPSSRWRQLRASALALESMIFQYRARVGAFTQSVADTKAPDRAFCDMLQIWREELVSGTDLLVSALEKQHNSTIFKHNQYSGPSLLTSGDDYHSPVKPESYISIRLLPAKDFYQKRIPERARWRSQMQLLVLTTSSVIAVLTFFNLPTYVAIISAAGAAITSWQEFTDTGRKIERYTNAVRSIKNVHSWWFSLSEVEKASAENITSLIMTGEAIIANEYRAWKSTAAAKKDSEGRKNEADDGNEDSRGNGKD
mmetsp:Transcript_26964/g.65555  ORF Transcript_26964/g.65555 Transcript_26964/m.65555 type:complete len:789 (-) Transcript_26964:229-2595(-)